MKKSKKKTKETKFELGCLSYIWIICIVVGVIISLAENDFTYLFIFTVAPPCLYIGLKYGWYDYN